MPGSYEEYRVVRPHNALLGGSVVGWQESAGGGTACVRLGPAENTKDEVGLLGRGERILGDGFHPKLGHGYFA